MERDFDLKELEAAVHKELDYSLYTSTQIKDKVNCYTHAIGATSIGIGLRIGEICGKKPILKAYDSDEEIKNLFIEDMKKLHLICREIDIHQNKFKMIERIKKLKPMKNEAVVMLFVQHNSDGYIRDFHFWRFDNQKGFSEKRFWHELSVNDTPEYSWPADEMNHFVGAYFLKR